MKRLVPVLVVATLLLAGCAGQDGAGGGEAAAPAVSERGGAPTSRVAAPLLADYGLDGMDTVEIVDHLDRMAGADRPADLMASVRPDVLALSSGRDQVSLAMPEDRFYLSVAPYVDQTHECSYHSLTTCTGELSSTDVRVRIVDETNDRVLVDETRTTFDNGFTGFWLPRDIVGTLRVTAAGRTGQVRFATDEDAPTCLTTLQLV